MCYFLVIWEGNRIIVFGAYALHNGNLNNYNRAMTKTYSGLCTQNSYIYT